MNFKSLIKNSKSLRPSSPKEMLKSKKVSQQGENKRSIPFFPPIKLMGIWIHPQKNTKKQKKKSPHKVLNLDSLSQTQAIRNLFKITASLPFPSPLTPLRFSLSRPNFLPHSRPHSTSIDSTKTLKKGSIINVMNHNQYDWYFITYLYIWFFTIGRSIEIILRFARQSKQSIFFINPIRIFANYFRIWIFGRECAPHKNIQLWILTHSHVRRFTHPTKEI